MRPPTVTERSVIECLIETPEPVDTPEALARLCGLPLADVLPVLRALVDNGWVDWALRTVLESGEVLPGRWEATAAGREILASDRTSQSS